jgi:glycosyltransferase involved in cell wall biosynthesis
VSSTDADSPVSRAASPLLGDADSGRPVHEPARPLVHVLGAASAGEPTTATARALCDRLARAGRPGRLVAARPSPGSGVEQADAAALASGDLVVHTVDGGEALTGLLPDLAGRPVRLVHQGSCVGSDRSVLRSLRGTTVAAAGADAAAREELRGLGFGSVAALPADAARGALDGTTAEQDVLEHLARHPGPRIVSVGPITPNRGFELLLDAFGDLITELQPSATLSLCGPASHWYAAALRRRILTRGLLACELLSPDDERAVVARLDRADVVVSLHPAPLDPYLQRAAAGGATVVAPRFASTAWLDARGAEVIAPGPGRGDLVDALDRAIDRSRRQPAAPPPVPDAVLRRILGIG